MQVWVQDVKSEWDMHSEGYAALSTAVWGLAHTNSLFNFEGK